jgi:predicted DNA-binding transcriptional regulator YafY
MAHDNARDHEIEPGTTTSETFEDLTLPETPIERLAEKEQEAAETPTAVRSTAIPLRAMSEM